MRFAGFSDRELTLALASRIHGFVAYLTDTRFIRTKRHHHAITWLFTGYDGTVILAGNQTLPWHDVAIPAPQPLPAILRTYPPGYTLVQRVSFRFFKKPETVLPNLMRRITGWIGK